MTTRITRLLKAALIPGLLATWLYAANPAMASSIIDLAGSDLSAVDDGAENLPPSEYAGWFLTYDPSNEWTSAANIATMESWLTTAEQLSNDPFTVSTPQLTTAISSAVAAVPEPATLGLLGIALAFLLIYVPIRPPHRSLSN
jgi:hypothetical protein